MSERLVVYDGVIFTSVESLIAARPEVLQAILDERTALKERVLELELELERQLAAQSFEQQPR